MVIKFGSYKMACKFGIIPDWWRCEWSYSISNKCQSSDCWHPSALPVVSMLINEVIDLLKKLTNSLNSQLGFALFAFGIVTFHVEFIMVLHSHCMCWHSHSVEQTQLFDITVIAIIICHYVDPIKHWLITRCQTHGSQVEMMRYI